MADSLQTPNVVHKKHPSTMGAPEITAFLSWLATSQRVSSSTQNQALSALLFLYRHVLRIEVGAIEQVPRAKLPHRVPVVLSREEVGKIFKNLHVLNRGGLGVRSPFDRL